MKIALHRSIIFWSGLLVMGFVCWAWWDSSLRMTSATFRGYSFINGARGIVLNWDHGISLDPASMGQRPLIQTVDDASPFPPPRLESGGGRDMMAELSEYDSRQDEHWDPDVPVAMRALGARWGCIDILFGPMRYQKAGDWRLFVPHWIILLAVAAVWLGLISWRARRRSLAKAGSG